MDPLVKLILWYLLAAATAVGLSRLPFFLKGKEGRGSIVTWVVVILIVLFNDSFMVQARRFLSLPQPEPNTLWFLQDVMSVVARIAVIVIISLPVIFIIRFLRKHDRPLQEIDK
ncbi:MAG TPA: hypothetical protein VEW28_07180 [Candidatus Kapabacteria bacterium]|nr:hypothetical protein [Candidatus Kapabacteria bacterium]